MAVIARQGLNWDDPIVWFFLLLILVLLGLLVGEIRNKLSPTPALDDDRWGLRRTVAGFPGGSAMLGALGALIAATLVFAVVSSLKADKGPFRAQSPPLFKLPEGGKRQGQERREGQRHSRYRGVDASRAHKHRAYRASGGEPIAVRGPGAKGDPGRRGPKGDRGVRGAPGAQRSARASKTNRRQSRGGSHGSLDRGGGGSDRAGGGSKRARRGPVRARGGTGGRSGLVREVLPPAGKVCDMVAGILRCP